MALLLESEYETMFGLTVPSTYWRWTGLGIDIPAGRARGTLYAYASPEAFAAGKQPLGQRDYEISGEQFVALATALETGGQGISQIVYTYIRSVDEAFADAEDVA